MGQNSLNLVLRFILEILALVAVGYWGWTTGTGVLRYVLAAGLPLVAAILWGTFRVPDAPPEFAPAPVPVPGWLRLLLELGLFAFATWGLFDAGATIAASVLGSVVLVHYVVSYDRLAWLLKH